MIAAQPGNRASIGQAIKALEISESTILRWEKLGYIRPYYTRGGHRRYNYKQLVILKNTHNKYERGYDRSRYFNFIKNTAVRYVASFRVKRQQFETFKQTAGYITTSLRFATRIALRIQQQVITASQVAFAVTLKLLVLIKWLAAECVDLALDSIHTAQLLYRTIRTHGLYTSFWLLASSLVVVAEHSIRTIVTTTQDHLAAVKSDYLVPLKLHFPPTHRELALGLLTSLVLQLIYPSLPLFFPGSTSLYANGMIVEARSGNHLYENTNPDFEVKFGDKSDPTLNTIAFSSRNSELSLHLVDITTTTPPDLPDPPPLDASASGITSPPGTTLPELINQPNSSSVSPTESQSFLEDTPSDTTQLSSTTPHGQLLSEILRQSQSLSQDLSAFVLGADTVINDINTYINDTKQLSNIPRLTIKPKAPDNPFDRSTQAAANPNHPDNSSQTATASASIYTDPSTTVDAVEQIVSPTETITYEIVPDKGIKESIIVQEPAVNTTSFTSTTNPDGSPTSSPSNRFTFLLSLDPNTQIKRAMTLEKEFFFTDQYDNYLYHFQAPYMFDSGGSTSNAVSMDIIPLEDQAIDAYLNNDDSLLAKLMQAGTKVQQAVLSSITDSTSQVLCQIFNQCSLNLDPNQSHYLVVLTANPTWLANPLRSYPVTIDPTIIHDSKPEFTAGTDINTLTTTTPSVELAPVEIPEITPGLVGLYHFNSDTQSTQIVTDSSPNQNHGTRGANSASNIDDPTWTSQGKIGNTAINALQFDGVDDYSSFPDSTQLRVETELSLEAWIKLEKLNAYQTIISKRTGSSGNWAAYLLRVQNGNQLFFSVEDQAHNAWPTWVSTETLTIGKWYHVAATWKKNQFSAADANLYINGNNAPNTYTANNYANTFDIDHGAYPVTIGAMITASNLYYFNGTIDETAIYNRALTPEEIAAHAGLKPSGEHISPVIDFGSTPNSLDNLTYEATGIATGDGETPYSTQGLIAQWNFNETSGTTAYNSAGTNSCGGTASTCNGTLSGFTDTSGQDTAIQSGWTAQNALWPKANPAGVMFDGSNDEISLSTSATALKTNTFTVEFWVKNGNNGVVFNTGFTDFLGGSDVHNYAISCGTYCTIGSGNNAGYNANVTSSNLPNPYDWNHITFTKDSTGARFYINGKLDVTAAPFTISYASYFCPSIGNQSYNSCAGNASYFRGDLDALKVYSRSLSASEILSNYQAGLLEFQTRTGVTSSPNDGTWETWKPAGSESAETTIDAFESSTKNAWISDEQSTAPSNLSQTSNINTGDGADGAITISANRNINTDTMISGRSCSDGGDAVNYTNITLESAGETSVTLSTTPSSGCLNVGDEILIINLQGTSSNYANVGKYETHTIASIDTATLNFTDYPLRHTYDGTTQKIMVQRVPNYTNVTIDNSYTLTASAWDGTKGGVLFFRASGTVTNNGTIDMSGNGYRGGTIETSGGCSADADGRGYGGETYNGFAYGGTFPWGSPASIGGAGGGGNANNTITGQTGNIGGGGGGGAWNFGWVGGKGGGGGYATAGTGTNSGSGTTGGSTSTRHGGGGGTYGTIDLSQLMLGSGGGGGDDSGAQGPCPPNGSTFGGDGGGVIAISAATVTLGGSSSIQSNGASTTYAGGGAGGSILINGQSLTLGSSLVSASAGAAPSGGAGGQGRITLNYAASLSGTTSPTAFIQQTPTQPKIQGSSSHKIQMGLPSVDNNTLALYHLDETNGDLTGDDIYDATSNSYDGELDSSTDGETTIPSSVTGYLSKSRYFNGTNDYIDMGNVMNIGTSNLTVEYWVKTTQSSGTWRTVQKRGTGGCTGSPQYAGYQISGGAGTFNNTFFCDGNSNYASLSSTNYGFNDGKWHHVAITWNNSAGQIKLYLDGIYRETSTGTGTYTNMNITTSRNFAIGAAWDDAATQSQFLDGTLDEIKISNTVRTPEEIAEAYRSGRDHYLNRTISSTDLSTKTKLPFYIAADRPGSYLQTTFGESAYANYQTDTNTVALWHLNEATGSAKTGCATCFPAAIDLSSNNLTGYWADAQNGTNSFTQGKLGKAREFAGTDESIEIPYNASLNITSNITLSAWVKMDDAGTDINPNQYIVIKGTGHTANTFSYALLLNNSGTAAQDTVSFSVDDGASTYGASKLLQEFSPNQWYHLVGVHDDANNLIKLYVNGHLVSQTAFSSSIRSASEDLRIGGRDDNTRYFDGTIDEVRIDNTVRSATDIRQAYEIGKRSHAITVDFNSSLDNTNLISATSTSASSDYSFNLPVTNGNPLNINVGETIIIKENYNGTESIAQGTVSSITYAQNISNPNANSQSSSTQNSNYATITVSSWHSGSTFPDQGSSVYGFTQSATVFKWQREYWDISSLPNRDKDAITNLSLRITDNSQGANIWLDDLVSADYLGGFQTGSGPQPLTINSTPQRYLQYRAILTNRNTGGDSASPSTPQTSPSLLGVTINHNSGTTPQSSTTNDSGRPADANTTLLLHMDEGSPNTCAGGTNDVCDSTANNRDGSFQGNTTFTGSGKFGTNSTTFDGSGDYISLGSFTPSVATTYEAWIYPTALPTTGNRVAIMGSGASTNWESTRFDIQNTADQYFLQVQVANFTGGKDRYWGSNSINFATNQWYHVAFSQTDASTAPIFYLNGENIGGAITYTAGTAPSRSTQNLSIGRNGDFASEYFTGRIDEVYISNVVRTQAEIRQNALIPPQTFGSGSHNRTEDVGSDTDPQIQLANHELPADAHTVGLWHMNEGIENTCSGGSNDICDSSTTAANGAFNGNAAFTTASKLGSHAVTFDGTGDYVSYASFTLPRPMTLEFWIKPDLDSTYRRWITNDIDGFDANTFAIRQTNTNTLDLYVGGEYITTGTAYVNNGVWNHYAVTLTDSSAHLYWNGNLVVTDTTNTANPSDALYIGGYYTTGPAEYTKGQIDEVRISDIARTSEEIKANAGYYPSGVYTSQAIHLGDNVKTLDNLRWNEHGVQTGDGEIPYSNQSLLGEWNFNEASGAAYTPGTTAHDTSSNNIHATLSNFIAGAYGQDIYPLSGWTKNNARWGAGAIMFDGSDDYVNVAARNWNFSTTGTMEAWVKTTDLEGTIMSVGHDTYQDEMLLYIGSGKLNLYHHKSAGNYWVITGNAIVNDNKWHHLVGVMNGGGGCSNMSIYVDGRQELVSCSYAGTPSDIVDTTARNLRIGNRHNSTTGGNTFGGTIDAARIYSRALTAAEILSNSQAGNIELQTRTSSDGTTWETWKPTTNERQLDNFEDNTDDQNVQSWIDYEINTNQTWIKTNNSGEAASDTTGTQGRLPIGATAGRADDVSTYEQTVLYDNGTYKMWYTGHDGTNTRILYATSADGLTWTKYNNQIESPSNTTGTNGRIPLGDTGTGDDFHTYKPTVIKDGNTYKMWYSGYDGSYWRIFYATSPDGLTWTKYNNQIESPSNTTGTNGRIPLGQDTSGDDAGTWNPTVIKDGNTYKMWYSGNDGSIWRTYYATSPDGLTWTKYNNSAASASDTVSTDGRLGVGSAGRADSQLAYNPFVIKDGNLYKMWYSMHNGTYVRQGYALSSDGLSWHKVNNTIPTVSDTSNSYGRLALGTNGTGDDYHAYTANVVKVDNQYIMYYSGYDGSTWRIYRAEMSPGPVSSVSSSTIQAENTSSLKTSFGQLPVDQHTVALWHLDETNGDLAGSDIFDATANNKDGEFNGSGIAANVISGIYNKARQFNGTSDNITTSDNGTFNQLSVEAWVKPDTITGTQNAVAQYATWPANTSFILRTTEAGSGVFKPYISVGGTGYACTGSSIPINKWSHIALTYDGETLIGYLNGRQDCQDGSPSGNLTNATGEFTIGSQGNSGTYAEWFDGSIDEVRISNIARTAEEITENYRMGSEYLISRQVSPQDLQDDTKLPISIAADRPGTYLSTEIGESAYANYQPDTYTEALLKFEERSNLPRSCSDLNNAGFKTNGTYTIDPDGLGGDAPITAYCDMTTDGGGWTIVAAYTGADGENPLTSNTTAAGNPLSFQHYNTTRAFKMDLSAIADETLVIRNNGLWIKTNYAAFNQSLNTANTHWEQAVTVTGSDGSTASGYQGYSNYNMAGGGDYGITTNAGFDHHSTSYYHLNSGCANQYLYSYSSIAVDSDAGYDVQTALGTWVQTANCAAAEGGTAVFYVAMRDNNPGAFVPVIDSSFHGNHGFIETNTASADVNSHIQGKIGMAQRTVNSYDKIRLGNDININNKDYTIDTWSQFPLNTTGSYRTLVRGSTNDHQILVDVNGILGVYNNGGATFASCGFDTDNLSSGWHHLAAVANDSANTTKFYIDGTYTCTSNFKSDAVISSIGNTPGGTQHWGVFDQFRVSLIQRTPEEIRQAYEYGLRTHPITIDFVSSTSSIDVAGTSEANAKTDTSITLDNDNMIDNVQVGETIIIKETYNGTEYIAQGEVTTIDIGIRKLTVGSWTGTVPNPGTTICGGSNTHCYTSNSTVFKWQTEYIDLTGIPKDQRDAITQIGIKITDASLGANVWVDDLNAASPYLSVSQTRTASITSTPNSYLQYRMLFTSSDTHVSPYIDQVTVQYHTDQKKVLGADTMQGPTKPGGADGTYDKDGNMHLGDSNVNDVYFYDRTKDQISYAMDFDGSNDYIQIPNESTFDFVNSQFTVEGWFKNSNTATTREILVAKGVTAGNYQWGIEIDASNKLLAHFTNNAGGATIYSKQSTSTVNDGIWHHFAAVMDTNSASENVTLYLDSVDQPSVPYDQRAGFNYVDASEPVFIGARGNGTINELYYQGQLDEVSIFSDARTEAEIKADYNARRLNEADTTTYDNLVSIWHFDDGRGTATIDSKGNNHGTLTNMTNDDWVNSLDDRDQSALSQQVLGIDPNWYNGVVRQSGALSFDGGDYVNLNSSVSGIEGRNTGSIAVWFKTSAAGPLVSISDKDAGTDYMVAWVGDYTGAYADDSMGFHIVRGAASGVKFFVRKGNSYYLDNQWHYAVFVLGNGDNSIYVDGVKQAVTFESGSAATVEFNNINNQDSMYIGYRDLSIADEYFTGQIDEVAIYTDARTATEISTDYRTRRHTSDANFLANWHFDEGADQTAYDVTTNNYDGTLGATSGTGEATDPTWVNNAKSIQDNNARYIKLGENSSVNTDRGMDIQIDSATTFKYRWTGDQTWITPNPATLSSYSFTSPVQVDQTGVYLGFDTTNGNFGAESYFKVTSWAIEAFSNSDSQQAMRGNRNSFPEQSYLVLTDTSLDILDARDNTLWMRFVEGGGVSSTDRNLFGAASGLYNSQPKSVFALNGQLYFGGKDGYINFSRLNFQTEYSERMYSSNTSRYLGNVATRNSRKGETTTGSSGLLIIHAWVNDIHAAVVQGQQNVAIATDYGLSVLNETSSAMTNTATGTTYEAIRTWITSKGEVYAGISQAIDGNWFYTRENTIAGLSGLAWEAAANWNATWHYTTTPTLSPIGDNTDYPNSLHVTEGTSTNDATGNTVYIGTNSGVSIIQENRSDETNGSVKYITKDYVSEEMIGDIRGMWPLELSNSAFDTEDISAKANTLTAANVDSTDSVSGVRGKAADLDGSSEYFYRASDTDFDLSTALTLSTWFKTSSSNPQNIYQRYGRANTACPAAPGAPATTNAYYSVTISNGIIGIGIRDNTDTTIQGFNSVNAYNDGAWHHLNIVIDKTNSRLYIYVDGILDVNGSTTLTENGTYTFDDPLYVGISCSDTAVIGNYFVGQLDEPFVTAEALTATQIRQMYISGKEALNNTYRLKLGNFEKDTVNELASDTNTISGIAVPKLLRTNINRPEGFYIATNSTTEDDGKLSFITSIGNSRIRTYDETITEPYLISDNDITSISTSNDGAYVIIGTDNQGITIIQNGSVTNQLRGGTHTQGALQRPHN